MEALIEISDISFEFMNREWMASFSVPSVILMQIK